MIFTTPRSDLCIFQKLCQTKIWRSQGGSRSPAGYPAITQRRLAFPGSSREQHRGVSAPSFRDGAIRFFSSGLLDFISIARLRGLPKSARWLPRDNPRDVWRSQGAPRTLPGQFLGALIDILGALSVFSMSSVRPQVFLDMPTLSWHSQKNIRKYQRTYGTRTTSEKVV